MEQAIPLLILGLAAGVLSGMFGIGGGVVIVPVLVTLFSYELKPAVATSLGALLLPVGIFAVIEYYRAGKMKISVSAIIALGLIVGGWFGSQLALNLPVDTLQRLYGAFLLYAAWRFMEPRKWLADIRAGTKPVEVVGHETAVLATVEDAIEPRGGMPTGDGRDEVEALVRLRVPLDEPHARGVLAEDAGVEADG